MNKHERMKRHIRASGSARGLSGRGLDRYVFGAMRARGWKPKRELEENIVRRTGAFIKRDIQRTGQDISRGVSHAVNVVGSPVFRYKKAMRYREAGKQHLAQGNIDRGLTMINRGNQVMQRYAPEVIGTGLGAAAGATAGFALPGSTEMGALGGQKVARFVTRLMTQKRRKK